MASAGSAKKWIWWLAPFWVPGLVTASAWAADHYIDDRINAKLKDVVVQLVQIDKRLTTIEALLRKAIQGTNPEQ